MKTIPFAKNPSHTAARQGWRLVVFVFALCLWVVPAATAQSLVTNGGFETGNFTGWTLSGGGDIYVDDGSDSGTTPYSGNYEAEFGTPGELGYISQTLTTTPGATYLLSFWLNSPDGLTPNEFQVSWNGTNLFDETDIPAIGWTNLQFVVTATGSSTVLQFGAQDDPSYLALDDVSVVATSDGHINIAHYTFDNSGSLGEDSSGNGNDLSRESYWGPQHQFDTNAEAGGGAVQFFGTDCIIPNNNQTLSNLNAVLAGSFTFSAWVKTTVTNGADDDNAFDGAAIFWAYNDQGNTNDTIPLAITGSKAAFTTRDHLGNSTTLHSDTSVNDGNYHLITVTRDQSTGEKKIYVDGNFETSEIGTTDPLNGNNYNLNIGGDDYPTDDTGTNFSSYNGLLDDVQIYTGVLSATNVAYLFSHPGTTVADVSGNTDQDFNAALGTTNLNWSTSGDTSWFTETTNTYNGSPSAAQSGSVTNDQSSTLSFTVTGPGTVTFAWSSIANDPNQGFHSDFYINGNLYDDISGDQGWIMESSYVGLGTYTLTWTTSANGDTDPTEAAFLDQVSYVPTPTLTASASPPAGLASLTVQFSTPDQDTGGFTVTNWNWNFGDGATSTAQNPVHTYLNPGVYFPSLVAYSTYRSLRVPIVYGFSAITVTNTVLTASANPQAGPAPLTVQFSTPGQDTGGFTVTNWNWNFGDGATSTAQNPTHTYLNPGVYSPSLVAYSTYSSSPLTIVNGFGTITATVTVTEPTNSFFNTLYSFTATTGSPAANSDGANPEARLIISGNTLYGTAYYGGSSGFGTVFAVNTNGADFANLYSFTNGRDGAYPWAELLLSGQTLYGTASAYLVGGSGHWGTIFAINTNGTGFTNLYNFTGGNDGGYPHSGFVLSGSTLFGTAAGAGAAPNGTVFAINTNGTGFTNLHAFSGGSGGEYPNSSVILAGDTLYGSTYLGGDYGSGTVFAVNTNGQSFTDLVQFNVGDPQGSLILSGQTLYGATLYGGSSNSGAVFRVNTDGTGFTNIYSFTGGNDGSVPNCNLVLSGNTLYGTTSSGGDAGNGTVFLVDTNGMGFSLLHIFTSLVSGTNSDGANPQAGLILSGNTFYGTTAHGGPSGNGTVFSFTLSGTALPVTLLNPSSSGANFQFQFLTQSGFTHNILYRTNLAVGTWLTNSTVTGDGTVTNISLPYSLFSPAKQGFIRVTTQ